MEIQEKNESTGLKLYNLLKTMSDNQYVQCPCKVTAVNGNYVDVIPIVNDELVNQPLYDVKVQRKESSTAYIYFKIHVGDRGVLRFFDRSIENYSINGSEEYNQDDRIHDANDGCFELGFLPDTESFIYPTDQEIEIALKNVKFRISVNENGDVDILSEGNVNLKITGDVTSQIDGDVTSTIKGDVTSTIEGDLVSTIEGDVNSIIYGNVISAVNGTSSTTVVGNANLTAPIINTIGLLNQVGNVSIEGNVEIIKGGLTSEKDVVGNGISLSSHTHKDSMGGDTSAPQ